MSVKIAVRIPDELAAKIDAVGKNRSVTIVTALESVFGSQPEPEKPKVKEPEKPRQKIKSSPGFLERIQRENAQASGLIHAPNCRCYRCKPPAS